MLAGMIATDKVVRIQVTKPFEKSALSRILELAFYDHRTDILVEGGNAISSVFGVSVPKLNNGVVD